MEYLKPIETLQNSLKGYQKMVVALLILLGVSIFAVPVLFKNGPYLIKDQESFFATSKSEPWKLTVGRIEGFTKLYIATRFEWTPENFKSKETTLKEVVSDSVFIKLKESLSSFRAIAQNQHASSFYVFEGYGFSNKEQKIEARITRVLRIKNVAIATPLIVRLKFQEVGVSETNPYGMNLIGIEESEIKDDDGKGGSS